MIINGITLKSQHFLADQWLPDQYALLDSGDGYKLERFGSQTVIRPDTQALWPPKRAHACWQADARFDSSDDGTYGNWRLVNPSAPDTWPMVWDGLVFTARRTPFRHLGLFQEHSVHWSFAQQAIAASQRTINVLNLFGYTGMMSLACARAGARVTHLDASAKSNTHGKLHQELSGLETRPIRWISDDVMKFTAREIRRGNRYDAIILDPPKFGHGPKNEIWRFETDLPMLLATIRQLLSDQPLFIILTAYAMRLSCMALTMALSARLAGLGGCIETGEMMIPHASDERLLPTAICARWTAG